MSPFEEPGKIYSFHRNNVHSISLPPFCVSIRYTRLSGSWSRPMMLSVFRFEHSFFLTNLVLFWASTCIYRLVSSQCNVVYRITFAEQSLWSFGIEHRVMRFERSNTLLLTEFFDAQLDLTSCATDMYASAALFFRHFSSAA